MKCPISRRWRVGLGCVVIIPPALWLAVVAVVPTETARRTIADRLSAASGRHVSLGGLRLGPLGGVYLTDLRIGAPASGENPWLRVGNAAIDVNPVQLLLGRLEPQEIQVDGLSLRVLRRRDGTVELGDFLQPADGAAGGTDADADERPEHSGIRLHVKNARVDLIDEPTGTRLEFSGVEGRATCDGTTTRVSELWGRLNGGTFASAFTIDRTGRSPSFEGQFKAQNVALADGMKALAYAAPVFAGTGSKPDGRLSLNLVASGKAITRDELRKTFRGYGDIVLDPIRLDGCDLVSEIGRVIDIPREGRIGAVRSHFRVADGKVTTDDLTLDVAKIPIVLSGSTDFDGVLSYRLKVEGLNNRLPARAKDMLGELGVRVEDVADARVSGNVEAVTLTVNGVALSPSDDGTPGDRHKLREIGRRLIDRIQR